LFPVQAKVVTAAGCEVAAWAAAEPSSSARERAIKTFCVIRVFTFPSETRLMMKNEHATHLFRIFPRAPDKDASAHMLRAGVGEKGFS
jgi:hypothetical protein